MRHTIDDSALVGRIIEIRLIRLAHFGMRLRQRIGRKKHSGNVRGWLIGEIQQSESFRHDGGGIAHRPIMLSALLVIYLSPV